MSRQTNMKRHSSVDIQLDRINTIAKRATKTGNRKVLTELCRKIDLAKTRAGNGKIPYGFVTNIVCETKEVCPWVSRDKVMNHYRSLHYDKFQKKEQEVVLSNQMLPPLHREKR